MRKTTVLAAMMLAGCSAGKDVPAAGAAVTRFHQQLDAGRIDQIEATLAPEMRQGGQVDFKQLLAAIRRKLGDVHGAQQTGWNDNYNTAGHLVTVAYKTRFARGDADEQFTWRDDAGKLTLAGYHINSAAMMID